MRSGGTDIGFFHVADGEMNDVAGARRSTDWALDVLVVVVADEGTRAGAAQDWRARAGRLLPSDRY